MCVHPYNREGDLRTDNSETPSEKYPNGTFWPTVGGLLITPQAALIPAGQELN